MVKVFDYAHAIRCLLYDATRVYAEINQATCDSENP